MGNKLGRRRQVVDDKYTRPQGLYQQRDVVDHKRLRKLILDSKLAPCYPGDEECAPDLEECPICFLYYPSLNRSRCCMKGICTECFLQMKTPHSPRPTQCPFCKTPSYAVEYRGARTKEEKGKEQIEEQRVIEAKIRMQLQERQDEEEKMQKRQAAYSSSRSMPPGEVEYQDISSSSISVPSYKHAVQGGELVSYQNSSLLPANRRPSNSRSYREDEVDLDLEEVMVMEAIWLSIQEHGSNRDSAGGGSISSIPSSSDEQYMSHAMVLAEPPSSSELVSSLAEHHHVNGDSANVPGTSSGAFGTLHSSSCLTTGDQQLVGNHPPENWIEVSPGSGRTMSRDDGKWATDHGSEMAEAGTSHASSDVTVDAGAGLPYPDSVNMPSGHFLPETFEEQMMLAMTVSLADARARTNTQGMTWL